MSLERPLLFFHVEKAGGSSIEEVVARHLGAQAVKLPASPAAQLEQGQRGGLNHTVIIPGYFGWSPFLLEATLLRLINHTACAVAFMGHFSVLPLLRLLVQIDRGEMGPVRCRRWRWPRSGDATALAWGALSRSDCVTVLRDPLERARSSWNFFNYAGGSNCRLHCGPTAVGHLRGTSWCADCSPLRFEEAVRVLGARAVLRKTRGNLALHRLGALSGGLASASATADADLDNETASTLARASAYCTNAASWASVSSSMPWCAPYPCPQCRCRASLWATPITMSGAISRRQVSCRRTTGRSCSLCCASIESCTTSPRERLRCWPACSAIVPMRVDIG